MTTGNFWLDVAVCWAVFCLFLACLVLGELIYICVYHLLGRFRIEDQVDEHAEKSNPL